MGYFTSINLKNIRIGRYNISAYKMLIQFMLSGAKGKQFYIDKPIEDEAYKIYSEMVGYVLSFNDNRRCQSYSWYLHVRYVQK